MPWWVTPIFDITYINAIIPEMASMSLHRTFLRHPYHKKTVKLSFVPFIDLIAGRRTQESTSNLNIVN